MSEDPGLRFRNLLWLGINEVLGLSVESIASYEKVTPKTVRSGIDDARRYGAEQRDSRPDRDGDDDTPAWSRMPGVARDRRRVSRRQSDA